MPDKPPVYKEFLVGLIVGGLFGPLIGWFIGTFAMFFAVTAMTSNVRGLRTSAFIGGLMGIPLGLATGLIVSLPLRLMSTRGLALLKNPWLAALVGAIIGWFCGYLILTAWYPTFGSLIYVVMVCMVVGGLTGSVAVSAKPKWL
jgi:hypothetical protein